MEKLLHGALFSFVLTAALFLLLTENLTERPPAALGAGDADGDGFMDAAETNCGSDPNNGVSIPERIDGIFAGVDDDLDVAIDEALPSTAPPSDCDSDGYTGTTENHVYSPNTTGDQDPCGSNNLPPTVPPTALGWVSDLVGGSFSANKVNIQDLTTYVAPVRYLNTDVGTNPGDRRWDVVPGTTFGTLDINILDLSSLVLVTPPMFGVTIRQYNGPTCAELPLSKQLFTSAQEASRNPASDGAVYLHNGALHLAEIDMTVPGRGMDFVLGRAYRSNVIHRSQLGYGWDHQYFRRLLPGASGDIVRLDGMGRADTYDESGGNYTPPAGLYTRLVRNVDLSFTERTPDGTRFDYAPFDPLGAARLTQIVDRNGNTMSFAYDANRRLTTVTDTLGRNYAYMYDVEGRLTRVTDYTGRFVQYAYDANGDLRDVISPAVTGTPSGNDFPTGKTTRYTYSTGFADTRLNHNLLTIAAPAEVAASGPARVVLTYETSIVSPNVDRVLTRTVGGTNASGIPAGGTMTYEYAPSGACTAPEQTCVTDANGNRVEYRYDAGGRVLRREEQSNRNIDPSDPADWVTTYTYNSHGELLTMTAPQGNSAQYTYDSGNSDRHQQGNLLQVQGTPDGARGGDQSFLRTSYTYDPMYNLVRTAREPRGNDSSYVPQNGGSWSAARYTTTYDLDYEEACDTTALGAKVGRTPAEVAALLSAAGMCASGVGDVNGDGTTTQVNGNAVRIRRPPVLLLPGSNQAGIDGSTQVPIEILQMNLVGQIIQHRDAEENVHTLEYYSEQDPDGDGTINNPSGNPTTGGYLKQVNVDTTSAAGRNSGTNPTPVTAREKYKYDGRGNVVSSIDGRGVETAMTVNQLGQVVQVARAAAVGQLPSIDPPEPDPLVAEAYLERYWYDYNNRLVLSQVEDRGNTQAVDGNLPSADLPSVAPNPDPVGGTAYQDVVYKFDILDNLLEFVDEVGGIVGPPDHPRTRYRYDRNGQQVLTLSPAANLAMAHPDRQVSNVESVVYDERGLAFTTTRGGFTAQFRALPANADIPGVSGIPDSAAISTYSYDYDVNGNLVRATDAVDTNGTGGPESTRYLYDGFDRRVSTVDAAGNQGYYQYDPMGNVVSGRSFGPVGGATPTSDAAATFTQPLTPGSFTQQQLARSDYKYDEQGRLFEADGHLYACNGSTPVCTGVTYMRLPVIVDGPLGGTNDGFVVALSEFDRSGRHTFDVEDDTGTTRYFYDGAGRVIKSLDAGGNTAESAYDDAGNVIETRTTDVATPLVPVTLSESFLHTYFYDSLSRPVRDVSNIGQTGRYTYDSRDNVVASSDALGSLAGTPIVRRAFPNGYMTNNVPNNPGNTHSYVYDGLNRMIGSVDDLRVGGTGAGVIDTSNPANPDGKAVADTLYDVNSRGRAVADDGSTTGDNNTSIGVIEPTAPLGNVTRTTYDDLNRPTMVTFDDGTSRTIVYDLDDNVSTVTDQNGSLFTHTYDGLNRLIQVAVTPGAGVANRSTMRTYRYDGLGRLMRATDNNDPVPATDDSTVEYAYDSLGRLLEERQQMGTSPPSVVSSRYSGDGNRTSLMYPDSRQYTYQYDALDRLANVQRQPITPEPMEPPTATYQYIGGRILERTYGTGVRLTYRDPFSGNDIGYDGARRAVRTRHLRPDNSVVADFQHTYDRMSNLVAEQRLHSNMQDTYTYDSLYRETMFTRDGQITPPGPPASSVNYTLDGIGDWDSHATDNNMGEYDVFQSNPRQYDNNGNLLTTGTAPTSQQFSYDAWDRLVRVSTGGGATQIADYRYDPMGRRIQKTVTNSGPLNDTISYSHDGGAMIQENGVNAGQRQAEGCGGPYRGTPGGTFTSDFFVQPLFVFERVGVLDASPCRMDITPPMQPAQPPLFYHEDGKGNVAALTDVGLQPVERYTYSDYGVTCFQSPCTNPLQQSSNQGNPFLFGGMHWEPEVGLFKSVGGLKYESEVVDYKPDEGRYLTASGLGEDLERWADFYAYAGNNPASGFVFVWASDLGGGDDDATSTGRTSGGNPARGSEVWTSLVFYCLPLCGDNVGGGDPARLIRRLSRVADVLTRANSRLDSIRSGISAPADDPVPVGELAGSYPRERYYQYDSRDRKIVPPRVSEMPWVEEGVELHNLAGRGINPSAEWGYDAPAQWFTLTHEVRHGNGLSHEDNGDGRAMCDAPGPDPGPGPGPDPGPGPGPDDGPQCGNHAQWRARHPRWRAPESGAEGLAQWLYRHYDADQTTSLEGWLNRYRSFFGPGSQPFKP